ncbi:Hypothetical Protein FCC1311_012692 [Hondaea fermentalgiana]|uniref:Uncharacterized protein n=1 Tax=Hondaea fermentalgiana TaxID=2315210 RepID=A0A2R5G239_9STRA|nr:Hypothetical Protein FCC1311_012692 [Hondaea fermentalgiana]|eukprot:GBG25052.1 Hypothetical Protein FCC1311_012692 [Hondaea fermentalgiana]
MQPARGPTGEEVAQRRAESHGVQLLPLAEAQRETNEKLLGGWVMLNETCPISNYPLLKDPRSGKVWSVRCQMEVSAEAPSKQRAPSSSGSSSSGSEGENAGMSSDNVPSNKDFGGKGLLGGGQAQNGETFADSTLQTERIAERLVQGWTLTSEICPISNRCPVLIDPASKRKWSPATGRYLDEAASPAKSISATAVSAAPAAAVAASATAGAGAVAALGGTPASASSQAAPSKGTTKPEIPPMDVMTKRINERLLKRWTMLADECPVTFACPLLQDPETKRKYSPALDAFVDEDPTPQAQETPEVKAETTTTTTTTTTTMRASELNPLFGGEDDDEDSSLQAKRLSQRLVQGWVMLDEECPITGKCPLMEEPNTGRKYSAALDKFIDEVEAQEESNAQETSAPKPSESGSSSSAPGVDDDDSVSNMAKFHMGSWTEGAMSELDDDLDGLDDVNYSAQSVPQKRKAGGATPRVRFSEDLVQTHEPEEFDEEDNLSTKSVESGVSLNGETKDELRRAEAVVRSKLREARDALARIEITPNASFTTMQTCDHLVRLVGTCVSTLRDVSQDK